MTISHPTIKIGSGAVVFAALGGFTCSICAPNTMTQAEVEAFAETQSSMPAHEWQCIDKSKLGLGSPTPNACNQEPDTRKHWFLISDVMP
jgi:hypothetical protein